MSIVGQTFILVINDSFLNLRNYKNRYWRLWRNENSFRWIDSIQLRENDNFVSKKWNYEIFEKESDDRFNQWENDE